mmetsp:Transcript_1512/g.2060  ORF Transcript_1512/g.2060 Transcript_1512/m.2060 type:complete len:308 (-) Transcript_1512:65-988(-)
MVFSSFRMIFLHIILLQLWSLLTFLPFSTTKHTSSIVAAATQKCDMCMFGLDDPEDCNVYGQLGDDILIGWSKASQQCLDAYNIKSQSMDPATLNAMFPNTNGSGGNIGSFVNYARFNSDSTSNTIKAGYANFFKQDEMNTNLYALKDTVVSVDGTSVDCTASQSNCYNAWKEYLAVEPGLSEMAQSGCTLHNLGALDREKEQSLIRIRLCQEGDSGLLSACYGLAMEVQDKMDEHPTKFCSAFGLGPVSTGENQIPGCTGTTVNHCSTNGSVDHTPNIGPSSASTMKFLGKMWIVGFVVAVVILDF